MPRPPVAPVPAVHPVATTPPHLQANYNLLHQLSCIQLKNCNKIGSSNWQLRQAKQPQICSWKCHKVTQECGSDKHHTPHQLPWYLLLLLFNEDGKIPHTPSNLKETRKRKHQKGLLWLTNHSYIYRFMSKSTSDKTICKVC